MPREDRRTLPFPPGTTAYAAYMCAGDGQGAAVTQTRTHNKANEIEDTGETPNAISGSPDWIDPAYDLAGNMTKGPKPGDEAATTSNYTYDAWNRLVKVADGETTVAEYRYDGRHRRIRKYTAPSGDNWTVREYYYNESWQVLEIRKATKTRTGGAEPALADTLHKQYVWGADYIDSPVVRFRDSSATPDGVLDETLYYTHDAQFNVTALVTPAGAVAERYMYAPYGQVTVLNGASGTDPDVTGEVLEWSADTGGSDYDNEILYCGYRFDPESGLYQVRYRYHHPTLGRWVTRDPIVHGDGMNRDRGDGGVIRNGTAGPAVAGGFVQRAPVGPVPYSTSITSSGLLVPTASFSSPQLRNAWVLLPQSTGWEPRPETQYQDGMNTYQFVRSDPVGLLDPMGLAAKKCKWSGTISGSMTALIIGAYTTIKVWATGTDGCDNYAVSGRGSMWFGGAGLVAGYLTLSVEFEDFEAPCQWPIKNGSFGSLAVVGGGGNAGIPISGSWVYGFAGDFRGMDWFSTGGLNVFIGGGGWTADLTEDIKQVGPTPIKKGS